MRIGSLGGFVYQMMSGGKKFLMILRSWCFSYRLTWAAADSPSLGCRALSSVHSALSSRPATHRPACSLFAASVLEGHCGCDLGWFPERVGERDV